jgi:hypothetical protein
MGGVCSIERTSMFVLLVSHLFHFAGSSIPDLRVSLQSQNRGTGRY